MVGRDFTKTAMECEFAFLMYWEAIRVLRVFGEEAADFALRAKFYDICSIYEEIPWYQFEMYPKLIAAAVYAFEARATIDGKPVVPTDFSFVSNMRDYLEFIEVLITRRLLNEVALATEQDPYPHTFGYPEEHNPDEPPEIPAHAYKGICKDIAQRVEARLGLDQGQDLTLAQIAVLAGMNERSVMNAVKLSGEGQLKVKGERDQDNNRLVAAAEALRWLKRGRNFQPTVIPGDAIPDRPDRIETYFELGHFLRLQRERLGMTREELAKELEKEKGRTLFVQGIEEGDRFDPADSIRFSGILGIEEPWFTEQVMRLAYPDQMSLLQGSKAE